MHRLPRTGPQILKCSAALPQTDNVKEKQRVWENTSSISMPLLVRNVSLEWVKNSAASGYNILHEIEKNAYENGFELDYFLFWHCGIWQQVEKYKQTGGTVSQHKAQPYTADMQLYIFWCYRRDKDGFSTLGLSVFGSLSTFSIAVRASKPPTTLKESKRRTEDYSNTAAKSKWGRTQCHVVITSLRRLDQALSL